MPQHTNRMAHRVSHQHCMVMSEGSMRLVLNFLGLIETILRIAIKLVLIFTAAFVAFIAAITWKK